MAHDIENKLEEFKNFVDEQLKGFREQGEELGEDAKDQLRKVRDSLQEKIEEIDNEIGSQRDTASAQALMGGSGSNMSSSVGGGTGVTSSSMDDEY